MKRSLSLSVILFAFLLTACSGSAEATPTPTSMANEIYTIVAQIMEDEATAIPPTATPEPTATTLPTPTKASAPTAVQSSSYTTTTSYVCDDSVYVSDVTIADYTEITAGETFTKTWQLQNTGTCAWTETYTVNYISGSSMSGESTEIGEAVVSGGTVNVSVELTAPTTAGTYTGYWQLANDSDTTFGASFYVIIVVPETVTSTPTSTSEYTLTPTVTTVYTSTATATATATATTVVVEPTSTPTATATSTTEATTEESGTD